MNKKVYILLLILSLVSCRFFRKKGQSFRLIPVAQRNLVKSVEANGQIDAISTVDVLSPIAGRLEKIFVKEGDFVRAKQKIALVSSDSRSLFLDMANSKDKKEVEYWKSQLQLTPIIAPTTGKIISVKAELDSKISGPILQISKGEIVRANIDEADLPRIHIGQKVIIQFDIAPEKKLVGRLETVAQVSKLVNNVNVYPSEISLPSEEKRKALPFEMKIGMSVTLIFPGEEKKGALALPLDAVNGQAMTSVTLIKEDDQKTKVKLGEIYGNWVEVISGLQIGEKVKVVKFKFQSEKERKSPLMLKRE